MKKNFQQENCRACVSGLCCTKIINLGVIRNRETILRNINLHIHCGELTALIGPNGAGKTTLLKAILGEVPHTGKLEFIDSHMKRTSRSLIGYVPQKLDFDTSSPLTVLDFFGTAHAKLPVWFGHSSQVKKRAQNALAVVQMEHLLNRRLGALSGGELQRVLLAMALDPVPNLLLLDEPVSGIDQSGLLLFYELVSRLRREYDLAIILVSHDLRMIEKYSDRVVFLRDKTIAYSGLPGEVLNNPKVRETLGLDWENALENGSKRGRSC
ncbi:MAG TPA: metal ABC transporter ATP-binding protein [Peptococcaceae bacterium]|nr:metal ABC transporter ATP-binding protein [Peptococcaceae bacterium]